MLDDNCAIDDIERQIMSSRVSKKKKVNAASKASTAAAASSAPGLVSEGASSAAADGGQVSSASGPVSEGATSKAAGGGRRSATSAAAAATSQSPSATGGGSAATSSKSASTSGLRKRGGGAADISTSSDVESILHYQFTKHAPQLHLGDFKDVIRNNPDWKGKYQLVITDPPFGILPVEHDIKISPDDLFGAAAHLLMPGGVFLTSSV